MIYLRKEQHRGDSAHSPVTCQEEMAAALQLPACGSPHPVPKNVGSSLEARPEDTAEPASLTHWAGEGQMGRVLIT